MDVSPNVASVFIQIKYSSPQKALITGFAAGEKNNKFLKQHCKLLSFPLKNLSVSKIVFSTLQIYLCNGSHLLHELK